MNTCRFCNVTSSTRPSMKLVKYGTRHYAHFNCYLKAGKRIEDLHDWQIVQFPYRLLKEHSLLPIAERAQDRLDQAVLPHQTSVVASQSQPEKPQ